MSQASNYTFNIKEEDTKLPNFQSPLTLSTPENTSIDSAFYEPFKEKNHYPFKNNTLKTSLPKSNSLFTFYDHANANAKYQNLYAQQSRIELPTVNDYGYSNSNILQLSRDYDQQMANYGLSYNPLEKLIHQKLLLELKIQEEFIKQKAREYWREERIQEILLTRTLNSTQAEPMASTTLHNQGTVNQRSPSDCPSTESLGKRSLVASKIEDDDSSVKKVKTEDEPKFVRRNAARKENCECKPQQSKWKNFPGHVMFAIRRACQSFFGEEKGFKLECMDKILSNSENAQLKFKEFIGKYQTNWKTYQTIIGYIKKDGDKEITAMLIQMIYDLLSEENSND